MKAILNGNEITAVGDFSEGVEAPEIESLDLMQNYFYENGEFKKRISVITQKQNFLENVPIPSTLYFGKNTYTLTEENIELENLSTKKIYFTVQPYDKKYQDYSGEI